MNITQAKRILRAARRRSLSWVALTVILVPVKIVDIDELVEMENEERLLVYPDPRIGAYVIFNVGGAV